jgi:NitT/TauT family transport system ATP-binding protein
MGAAVGTVDLTKSFGALDVIVPLTLSIEPGSFVSLLGPSGCGKSTLLRLLGGLETPTSGRVAVDGAPPTAALRDKRVAVVPQSPGLLPWRSVEANARLLLDIHRGANPPAHPDPLELLDEVGLGAFLRAKPHELSGGMQQRVALVRAFALGAPLVLMDEPFAALDEITRAEMRDLLCRMIDRHPTTVVFVTHSISEAVRLSDRVLVFSPRPAQVVADVAIPVAQPRSIEFEDTDEFTAFAAQIRGALYAAMRP